MASGKQVWFGTRELMQWVKAPATNMGKTRRAWESGTGFINGGYSQVSSDYSALSYTLSWSVLDTETQDMILGYADKVFGTGVLYFSDPLSWSNVMPLNWAAAHLTATDAPPLVLDSRPMLTDVTINGARFPSKAATYALTALSVPVEAVIPVPPGFKLIMAAYGSATGTSGLTITPTTGPAFSMPMLSTANITTGTGGYTLVTNNAGENGFVEIRLSGVGQLTLVGVHAYLVPIAENAKTFPYYPLGKGHSGLRFEGSPQVTAYSSVLDMQALSANLVETGAWE